MNQIIRNLDGLNMKKLWFANSDPRPFLGILEIMLVNYDLFNVYTPKLISHSQEN